MGIVVFFLMTTVIIIMICLMGEWEVHQEKAEEEKRYIEHIKKYVLEGYNEILDDARSFGNEFYASLNDFATKMDKLSSEEAKADLKPYDIYNITCLYTHFRCHIVGRIVINKNLVPKFMAVAPSLNRKEEDIQLEAAYSSDDVRKLAETCRNIKMNIDIENYRKEKVKKVINGE